MFSHRRKGFQSSVFFLKAVNNTAGGGSVTAPGILIPWLPSALGDGGQEMLRELGLSTMAG